MNIDAPNSSLRARVLAATPVVLRPVLAVLVLGVAALLAGAAQVLVYRLFGESRSANVQFIGWITVWFSFAGLMHGICLRYLTGEWELRPWVHGTLVSGALWGSGALLAADTALQSRNDVLALIAVTGIFALGFGYALWKIDRSTRAKDA